MSPLGFDGHSLPALDLILSSDLAAMVNDSDKDEWKKHLEKAVTAIISYHTLPVGLGQSDLEFNTTYATSLANVKGALNNEPLRLRAEKVGPFGLILNAYSKVIGHPVVAQNGESISMHSMCN